MAIQVGGTVGTFDVDRTPLPCRPFEECLWSDAAGGGEDRLAAKKKAWRVATEYVRSTDKTAGTNGKPQSHKSHLHARPISIDSVALSGLR